MVNNFCLSQNVTQALEDLPLLLTSDQRGIYV